MYKLEVVFAKSTVTVKLIQCGTRTVHASYRKELALSMENVVETIVLAGDEFSTNRETKSEDL